MLRDIAALRWSDSTWAPRFVLRHEAGLLPPVIAPRGKEYLVWQDYGRIPWDPSGAYQFLFLAEVSGDSISPLDTVAVTLGSVEKFAAAVSPRRRWVVASDQSDRLGDRVLVSDTLNRWRPVHRIPRGSYGYAFTPLDDTTAIMAWADPNRGVSVAIVRGSLWTESLPFPGGYPVGPRFRPRPGGGQWLAWGGGVEGGGGVFVASYSDGQWSAPRIVPCEFAGFTYPPESGAPDLSRDEGEYPVIVWCAVSGIRLAVCVSVPNDTGFTVGEELSGSYNGMDPTVARDVNEDVWVAWWVYSGGTRWLHTYTSAITSAPRALGPRARPVVTWTLSEPAPGSWWMVQRSRDDEDFESVARVRAGPNLTMSYADTGAPNGKKLRYRIRRECLDVRYQWLSEESEWRERGHVFAIKPRSASPLGATAEFTVEGAEAGPLEIGLYDIQGRLVLRREVAWAPGTSSLNLDLGAERVRLASGVYFLRATDAAGEQSEAVRVLLLR